MRYVFLAMAHQRLGDARKAREYLNQFRRACAENLALPEARILLHEAEAAILDDPGFPADTSAFAPASLP